MCIRDSNNTQLPLYTKQHSNNSTPYLSDSLSHIHSPRPKHTFIFRLCGVVSDKTDLGGGRIIDQNVEGASVKMEKKDGENFVILLLTKRVPIIICSLFLQRGNIIYIYIIFYLHKILTDLFV